MNVNSVYYKQQNTYTEMQSAKKPKTAESKSVTGILLKFPPKHIRKKK